MNQTTKMRSAVTALMAGAAVAAGLVLAPAAEAAVPGIAGMSFTLTAAADYSSQPDGNLVYSWGYGCSGSRQGIPSAAMVPCTAMQIPGPTLVVTEGEAVTVRLVNNLPAAAGNTSIVFPGFNVSAPDGVSGRLAQEAANGGGTVTYSFTAAKPGTYAYYSGTQADLQIEMGMYGAIVVLPNAVSQAIANCPATKTYADATWSRARSAYANPNTCYDREYLFQFAEMDSKVHEQVKAQVDACDAAGGTSCPAIVATMEPYTPNYFLVNGRSMPDDMDASFSSAYPNQPYNGNPHMHPGEMMLMRIVGQGRWQHPFHFHGNHARVIARDANLLLAANDPTALAGPLLFTTPTVSGQTQDQIFTWTGQGLNWDVYGRTPHTCNNISLPVLTTPNGDSPADLAAIKAAQSLGFDPATKEYCADHGKPIPVTPPDPTIVQIGQWYGGTPYLGLQTVESGYTTTTEPPGTLNQNPQAGYAYMWHSHNEREITTNDVFPGGMMMMLLIDPLAWTIDETQ